MRELLNGHYIIHKKNLLITGPTGCGKSWIANALGEQACRQKHSVRYCRIGRLLEQLAQGRVDGSWLKHLKQLQKIQVLILDDQGLEQLSNAQCNDLQPVDIMADEFVIFPDDRPTDIVQVQGSHDVQAGATAGGFHHMGFFPSRHPAISQFRSLRRMHAINEQDGFIVSGFVFQFFVNFHEHLLCFRAVFMRYASRFSLTEAVAVQPVIHARNGIADAPPFINQLNDALCGWKKVTGKMNPYFLGLFFAEMALRTAIFRHQFVLIQPVIEMTTHRCFMDTLRLRDHNR